MLIELNKLNLIMSMHLHRRIFQDLLIHNFIQFDIAITIAILPEMINLNLERDLIASS